MAVEILHEDGRIEQTALTSNITRYAVHTGLTVGFGHPAEAQTRHYDPDHIFQPDVPEELISAPGRDELALKPARIGVDVARQTDNYYNKHFRARDEAEIKLRERYIKRANIVGAGFLGAVALELFVPGSHVNADAEILTGFGAVASFWAARFGYGSVKRGLVKRGLEADPNT